MSITENTNTSKTRFLPSGVPRMGVSSTVKEHTVKVTYEIHLEEVEIFPQKKMKKWAFWKKNVARLAQRYDSVQNTLEAALICQQSVGENQGSGDEPEKQAKALWQAFKTH